MAEPVSATAWRAALALTAGVACWLRIGWGAAAARRRLRRLSGHAVESIGSRAEAAASGGRVARGERRSVCQADAGAVPAALDLLAACLAAGATLGHALEAVAVASGGPIRDLLGGVARLTALGSAVEVAWSGCLADAAWAPVARAVIRAHHSGAPLTDVLSRLAEDQRRAVRTAAEAATRRAAVRAVLPLGLCFLPAFVLVGVVPVVAGFARVLWH